jgi:hypothetical protein
MNFCLDIGWPALGDVYCNVGGVVAGRGSSSCTSRDQRARNPRTGSSTGSRPGMGVSLRPEDALPEPPRRTREVSSGTGGCPDGESRRGPHPRWTRAPRQRILPRSPLRLCYMGLGCVTACTTHQPSGHPGLVTQYDCTTGQAGGAGLGRPVPARPTQPLGRPGPYGLRPSTGAEGPAY